MKKALLIPIMMLVSVGLKAGADQDYEDLENAINSMSFTEVEKALNKINDLSGIAALSSRAIQMFVSIAYNRPERIVQIQEAFDIAMLLIDPRINFAINNNYIKSKLFFKLDRFQKSLQLNIDSSGGPIVEVWQKLIDRMKKIKTKINSFQEQN